MPVYNEQNALVCNIPKLCSYLESYFPYHWSVVIVDNASTDSTLSTARELAAHYHPRLSVLHLKEKGRGRALKTAWLASQADIVTYMDVDLSTNLWSFLSLVAPLASGHSDLAIGSRLLKGAMVTRQWKREVISRCYNLLIKLLFRNRFTDAQCGFKALRTSVARSLVPQVEDEEWFFDTEVLLLAEERGYRISEVAVDWIEDLDSRVEIVSTALEDVKGLLRVRAQRLRRQLSPNVALTTPWTPHVVLGSVLSVSTTFLADASDALHGPLLASYSPNPWINSHWMDFLNLQLSLYSLH